MNYKTQLTLYMEWLWSFDVRARDGFICQLNPAVQQEAIDHLSCTGVLQGAHLITRNVKGIKFDLRNGRCLCQAHHKYYTHHPEQWARICVMLWRTDWEYLMDRKWRTPAFVIDREKVFANLMHEATVKIGDFPEYTPKLKSIINWMDDQGGLTP